MAKSLDHCLEPLVEAFDFVGHDSVGLVLLAEGVDHDVVAVQLLPEIHSQPTLS